MLLKYFYDNALAHASYMVACQKAEEAVIVDPGRNIRTYLEMARREGVSIVGVAETHIHADYVSGARELADQLGARLYVSDEGPPEWKYKYAADYSSQLLKEGDTFYVGKVKFATIHTPGHTPESVSFLLTDEGGGATQPMGIFTGDFVFVGSIGRPDLLEEAAGVAGSALEGARQLFHSAQRFKTLPDYLQIWPAHGAGSACGKGLGSVPSSTVGYEKLFNPALQFENEAEFVAYILADQPEAPKYFAIMKRVNKEGPHLVGLAGPPTRLAISELATALEKGTVIDCTPAKEFAKAHIPGTINLPAKSFARWAGWIVNYERPLYLISSTEQSDELLRITRKIGLDNLVGFFDSTEIEDAGLKTESYPDANALELKDRILQGKVRLIDVRSEDEWQHERIEQAEHHFLGRLLETGPSLVDGTPLVTQCQGGGRSAIAASILQSLGANVTNLSGGLRGWQQQGFPVQSSSSGCHPEGACENAGKRELQERSASK